MRRRHQHCELAELDWDTRCGSMFDPSPLGGSTSLGERLWCLRRWDRFQQLAAV